MKPETLFFIGKSIETVQQDYDEWKKQFDDYVEYNYGGCQFCLVQDQTIHLLVLYVERVWFYNDDKLYYMELSAMETFENIDDAQARVRGVIEYYTRGKVFLDDNSR